MEKIFKIFFFSISKLNISFTLKYFFYLLPLNIFSVIKTKSLNCIDKKLLNKNLKYFLLNFREKDFPLIREIILFDCYNFDINRRYDVIIDLGSNCGIFTVFASGYTNKIISVEMNYEVTKEFQYLLEINNVSNNILINKSISSISTESSICMNDLFSQYNIYKVDFLKIDIEGAERDIFNGNKLDWLFNVEIISMEVHPCFDVDVDKIVKILRKYNFRVNILNRDFKSVLIENLNDFGFLLAQKNI